MIIPHYQLSRRLVTGLKRTVIGASIALLSSGPCFERTSRAEDIAPPKRAAQAAQIASSRSDLEQTLKSLQTDRDQLENQRKALRNNASFDGRADANPDSFSHLQYRLRESDMRTVERLQELHWQILELDELLRKAAAEKAAKESAPPPPTAPSVPSLFAKPAPLPDAQVDPHGKAPVRGIQPTPAAGTVVMNEPVDRLALATNLYRIGEYGLALDGYERLLADEPKSPEQWWIRFQIAACYRKLGNPGKAEQEYRLVAGQSTAGFPAEAAKWWLSSMQKRRELEQTRERIRQTIESMKREFDAVSAK